MTITIDNKEIQELIDIDYDTLLEDMDNLCQLINTIEIEDVEYDFNN